MKRIWHFALLGFFSWNLLASDCQPQDPARSEQWLQIWSRKGEKALARSTSLHEADGYDVMEPSQWESMVRTLLEYARLPRHGKVCEFGCGAGAFLKVINKMRPRLKLYGCDYTPSLIRVAHNQIPQGTFWVQDVIQSLPEVMRRQGPFDVTICHGVFMYINSAQDVEKMLEEMASVTAPGGMMVLGDISDLAKKEVADNLRAQTHNSSKQVAPNVQLDHLYLPRDLFEKFAVRHGATITFVEYDQTDPKHNYPNRAYRFNAIIRMPSKPA